MAAVSTAADSTAVVSAMVSVVAPVGVASTAAASVGGMVEALAVVMVVVDTAK
jgi:hypothetical protein